MHGTSVALGTDIQAVCWEVFFLQETSDAGFIAEQKFSWLKVGCYYMRKDDRKIFKFAGITAVKAQFTMQDIFGQEENLEVAHENLVRFKASDKSPPTKLESSLVEKLQPEVSQTWSLELERAKVQAALLVNYKESPGRIHCGHPHACFGIQHGLTHQILV